MSRRKGFTLLELLISITLFAFALAASYFVLQNQLAGNLTSDEQIMADRLQEAQARAVAGVNGSAWGIHIDNATTTPFYALFSGTSYGAASSTYYLSGLVQFAQPVSGTTTDIVFSKLTGTLATTTSIILKLRTNASTTATITITANGQISAQ